MALTGDAKREYQRKYMEAKRSNSGSNIPPGLTGSNTEIGSNNGEGLTQGLTATEPSYVCLETGEIKDGAPVGLTDTKGTENMGSEAVRPEACEPVAPCSVEHLFDPDTGLDWQPVKAYISKPDHEGMSNLERLQKVAGALGNRAEDVRFGLSGPTFKEIGKLLGKEEALWPR